MSTTLRYLQNLHPRFKSALRQAQGVVSEVEPRAAPPNFQFKFDRLFVERAICALQMAPSGPKIALLSRGVEPVTD